MEVSDLAIPAKGTVIDEKAWAQFMREYAPNCDDLLIKRYADAKTGEIKYAISYGLHSGGKKAFTLRELLVHQLKLENMI